MTQDRPDPATPSLKPSPKTEPKIAQKTAPKISPKIAPKIAQKTAASSAPLAAPAPSEGIPIKASLLFFGFSLFYGYLVWVWVGSTLSAWDQSFERSARNTSLSLRQMVDREVQTLRLLSAQPNRRDLLFFGTGIAHLEKGSWSLKSVQPVRSGMDSNWVKSVLSEKLKEFPLSLEVGAVHLSLIDLPPSPGGSPSANRNSSPSQAYLFAHLDEELHLALIDLSLWSGLLDTTLRTDFEVVLVNREGQTLAHVEPAYVGKSAGLTPSLKGSAVIEPLRIAETNLLLWLRPRAGVYESRLSSIAGPLSLALGGYAMILLAAFFVARGWVRRSQAWAQALADAGSLRGTHDSDGEDFSYGSVSSGASGRVPDGQLPLVGYSADSQGGAAVPAQPSKAIPSGRAIPKHFLLSNEALSEKMKLIDELTNELSENSAESSLELDLDAIEKSSHSGDLQGQHSVERGQSRGLSSNQKSEEKLDDKDDKIDQPPKASPAIKGEG